MPFKKTPPLYNVWASMRDRCRNPKSRCWNDYGGRGVKICSRWDDFHAFAEDMGPRPKGYTLDRIDNNGGYEPENCRWATRKQQQLNRRVAVYVTVEGKKYRAIELAEKAGVKTDTIIARAAKSLPMEDILSSQPLRNDSGLSLGGPANGERQKAKTHCPNGHEYTADNLVKSKSGYRKCKTCHREKERARRELLKSQPH